MSEDGSSNEAEEMTSSTVDSPMFKCEGDPAPTHVKEPLDCSASQEHNMFSLNCKSFESSDDNIGMCVSDRSQQLGECTISADIVEDDLPDNDDDMASQAEDDESSVISELFDENTIMKRFDRSTSEAKAQEVRRTRPKHNVRRKTDGGLDKLKLPTGTNSSFRLSGRRRSMSGSHQSITSSEAPSYDGQSFLHRLRTRMRDSVNSTFICSPLRRYSKKLSSIQVMEDQCFVPPPSDGVTFSGAAINTMRGFGVDFVIWVNQSSFLKALILFLSSYYALVCVFASILMQMEMNTDGTCLDLSGDWTRKEMYELTFELSWTTFTSVGYGQISPSGYEYGCYSTRVLCASFAFMGLLFNSLSAAIFFSKLERFLTRSCVTFSSSVCVQHGRSPDSRRTSHYGQFLRRTDSLLGMGSSTNTNARGKSASLLDHSRRNSEENSRKLDTNDDEGDDENNEEDEKKNNLVLHAALLSRKMPYPFLEFRIVNEHANYKRREIRNAHVSAMVQLTPADSESMMDRNSSVSTLLREYVTPAPSQHAASQHLPSPISSDAIDSIIDSATGEPLPTPKFKRLNLSFVEIEREDSGTGDKIGPEGRVYLPLKLEPSSHPYFKRVYYVHHVLDQRSPLLKQSVRSKIKNGWDATLSSYQDIRESLVEFRKIRIIFKGNSAVNNSMVFAEKVYTSDDFFVGWQFGNIFYKRERRWWRWRKTSEEEQDVNSTDMDDDDLMLDKRLIHDIFPQKNASYEPLREENERVSNRYPRWDL
ncbi:hypothetical protein ACHAWO_009954 [Cyclotella atomus]|uniref:Potassium channel domain-containing protein n=1 Tax=Cyclotella atomus TaxID=382360 RepID=A0ABD3QHC5_9STRA